MLFGQEILDDVAKAFDADSQGVKRNFGAVAQGAVVEVAGGGPTLQGEVLEDSASGADVGCTLWQRAAPLAPLLAVEFLEGGAGFALLFGFAADKNFQEGLGGATRPVASSVAAAAGIAGPSDAGPSIRPTGMNSTFSGAPIATAAALRADRQL